jgi:hypothetical protein
VKIIKDKKGGEIDRIVGKYIKRVKKRRMENKVV